MTRNGVAQLEVCMLAFFVSHEALKRVGKRKFMFAEFAYSA